MRAFHPNDRRPIAARHWRLSQAAARWLARQGVSANAISLAGLFFGILAGAALTVTRVAGDLAPILWLLAAVLIVVRLLANMLDGMVAVESGRATPLGALLNEVPDRISDVAILVGFGYGQNGSPVLGYAAALSALFTAYVRAAGAQAGVGQEFCGPMAKQQRMAVVIAVCLVSAILPLAWLPTAGLILIAAGGIVTAVRRLARQASQLRKASS